MLSVNPLSSLMDNELIDSLSSHFFAGFLPAFFYLFIFLLRTTSFLSSNKI